MKTPSVTRVKQQPTAVGVDIALAAHQLARLLKRVTWVT
jgi:hypothetical protein